MESVKQLYTSATSATERLDRLERYDSTILSITGIPNVNPQMHLELRAAMNDYKQPTTRTAHLHSTSSTPSKHHHSPILGQRNIRQDLEANEPWPRTTFDDADASGFSAKSTRFVTKDDICRWHGIDAIFMAAGTSQNYVLGREGHRSQDRMWEYIPVDGRRYVKRGTNHAMVLTSELTNTIGSGLL